MSTEVPTSVDRQQILPSSPNGVNPQDADTLRMVDFSSVVQSSAAQFRDDQHDHEVVAIPDPHLARAAIEQLPGDGHDAVGQQALQGPGLLTSSWPAGRRLDSQLPAEGSPTWRAHHQDFYASKWFRVIETFIVVSVVFVATVVFVFNSPGLELDLFASIPNFMSTFVLTTTFLLPVFLLLYIVVSGIFKSRVFR